MRHWDGDVNLTTECSSVGGGKKRVARLSLSLFSHTRHTHLPVGVSPVLLSVGPPSAAAASDRLEDRLNGGRSCGMGCTASGNLRADPPSDSRRRLLRSSAAPRGLASALGTTRGDGVGGLARGGGSGAGELTTLAFLGPAYTTPCAETEPN